MRNPAHSMHIWLLFITSACARFPLVFNCFSLLPENTSPASWFPNSTFDQQLDHGNSSAGTFSQWYMYNTQFWGGPGSPIILFTPGEHNATKYSPYLTRDLTTGMLAERIAAAIIVLEHRYWGFSSPFLQQTTENLQFLTVNNSIQDLVNFARNVKLPFDGDTKPDQVPWLLVGGSYPGALVAWTESLSPGTFWAYWASSAPVQAQSDFWQYFSAAQEHMPQNCSRDASLVIEYVDDVLVHGTSQEKQLLKAKFGLENVTHDDDFVSVLYEGPGSWQANQLFTGYSPFYHWCDMVEGVFNQPQARVPGPEGVGLEKALEGYATFIKTSAARAHCAYTGYPEYQGQNNTYCFDTHDPHSPMYSDLTVSNKFQRTWRWLLCNEPFGWSHGGPPSNQPGPYLVSKLLRPEYFIRQCSLFFPDGPNGETFGLATGNTENQLNRLTSGWETRNSTRLLYATGDRDPWEAVTISSKYRPSGPLQSSPSIPVISLPGGFHTSDLVALNGEVNLEVHVAIERIIQQMVVWVNEWPR
jgi:hypothetical protein